MRIRKHESRSPNFGVNTSSHLRCSTRLMYGSDWVMLAGESGLPSFRPWNPQPVKFYPDIVAEFFSEVKYRDRPDTVQNAVEFLGLSSAHRDATRGRLGTFHAGVNIHWLTEFD